MFDVIVVGGGAAGLMAAGVCAKNGRRVLLIEKNKRLGMKLGITGKGRCNVTNNCDVQKVIENTPTGGKFLYSCMSAFPPSETIRFFESLGVPLKTERGSRVFPVSDRASDIVDALVSFAKRSGAVFETENVTGLLTENGAVSGVRCGSKDIESDSVIICTGGCSYPKTGSDGNGYLLCKALGHSVCAPVPSLVPLNIVQEDDCREMTGLTLKNVNLRVFDGGKKPVFEELGEMLFCHFGVSGPLVLSASAHMRSFDKKKYRISIDLKPGLDEAKLDARILRDFHKYSNKDFCNSLSDLAARSMIPVLVRRSGIDPEKKVNSVTKTERKRLVSLFKNFDLDVSGPRPIDEAVITSGGISLKEIDPKTMQSRLVPGLYFAGEIINADAYTGGFNLQIAWATAQAAAKAVSDR